MQSLFEVAEEDRCDELRNPGFLTLTLSIIILVGLLISYLPQHYRIISRGTSEGISPYFVLLGVTSATSGFANVLTLPQSRSDVACCKELETFQCVAGLLGIAQLGVQWICFAVILVLFLVFFRYGETGNAEARAAESEHVDEQPKWQTAVMVAIVCVVHGFLVIAITGVLALVANKHLSAWANALGVMAAALACVQYLPQIYTTYHLKHVGSLSIPMMCIQTPGGFLFAGSLFARFGWAGWSTWGIYILTALMQGTLLSMAIYYELTVRGRHKTPYIARNHLNGYDDDRPTTFSAHPQVYADTPEQLEGIVHRQESEAAEETRPLLAPGGIGNPNRDYATTHQS